MKIIASLPTVRDLELSVKPGISIRRLRARICKELGIEPQFTSLLLDGKKLRDNQRLDKTKLAEGGKIIVDHLWARHLILWGTEGQRLIRSSSVLIVGAGALGNEVAKNLAMLGVSRFSIVDNDAVELSNTSRMIFFETRHVGQSKAVTLAKSLNRRFPYVEAVAYDLAVEDLPLGVFLGSDVIISGLDNAISRIYLAQICRRYSLPMVDAGIIGYQARVQDYIPPDSPCPACALPSSDYAQIAGLRNPCDAPIEEAKTPSLPTTISLASSIQTQEAVKLLLGYSKFTKEGKWPAIAGLPLKGILIIDLRFNRYSVTELRRNENCIVCGKHGIARETATFLEIPSEVMDSTTTRLIDYVKEKLHANHVAIFAETPTGSKMLSKGDKLSMRKEMREVMLRIVSETKGEFKETIARIS
jgi:molybdopterin/thiamine biosynthesis adenylyltransferase